MKPLKNCQRLEALFITQTKLKFGLNFLPNSLEIFDCEDVLNSQDINTSSINDEIKQQFQIVQQSPKYY